MFSAISPALVALRFYGNAEVLVNIASVYPAAHNSAEHQHSGHANSKAHQVYCSFCLDAASVQALTRAAPHVPLSAMAAEPPPRAVPFIIRLGRNKMPVLERGFLFLTTFFLLAATEAWAHGFAGKRFFPATLAVDDPFISDELTLLTNHIKEPDQVTNEFSVAYSKRITPNFGFELGETYQHLKPNEGRSKNGFANLDVGAKYQFFTSDVHETILSVGLDAELGRTGSRNVGAESFSTLSPTFFFGKGFGDLLESLRYLKPVAITGAIGPSFPTRKTNVTTTVDPVTGDIDQNIERNPTSLNWGLTFQYNLHYLQSFVQDVGLKEPFTQMIPVIELALSTCLNADCKGQTTGTVNPGIIWFGKSFQLGLEAQIPVNQRTGNHVGVLFQMHFFIDDLFPQSVGRPIFR